MEETAKLLLCPLAAVVVASGGARPLVLVVSAFAVNAALQTLALRTSALLPALMTAALAALLLWRPSLRRPLASWASGVLLGVWSVVLAGPSSPSVFVLAASLVPAALSAKLAARPDYVSEGVQEEGLLLVALLAASTLMLPAVIAGLESARVLNSASKTVSVPIGFGPAILGLPFVAGIVAAAVRRRRAC
ncbi:MAG: hypothetical protein AAGA81_17040 [Acidobacteriota bacterium]